MTTETINKVTDLDAISSAMPGDYYRLLKPRVMALVVFTAIVGLLLAPGSIHPLLGFVAILCIAVGAGASGALNMWYDADIDGVMKRTKNRPIPAGKVPASEALSFGLVLSVFSVGTMGLLINWLSAALLAFTIFFYLVIYTMWLKRSTPQNIVIGGAAGAFPPMIGWAAVTGSVSIESIILFSIIFLWTPPHFWALALFRFSDYEAVNVPMMPNDAGIKSTRNQILLYAVVMAISGVLPAVFGFASVFYGAFAAAMGGYFVWLSYKVWQTPEEDKNFTFEKKLFGFSILYLFAIFAVLGAEAILTKVMF